MIRILGVAILTIAIAAGTSTSNAQPHVPSGQLKFNRDIRPILAQYCFKCHGTDQRSREGKLRLDEPAWATGVGESGKRAIVPGSPDDSELIRRIFSPDEDEVMPPPHTKLMLPDVAKATLKTWISQGAEYEKHWAYVPPNVEAASKATQSASQAKLHPIDFFVRQRLAQTGQQPSPQADRYTLVRRVFLDLIGLPPTPAEADAFVHDGSPEAYEKLVDSLLESQQYGQRWARRWLDLARYADTNGFEKDRPRTIWPYRDWVVKALNDDLPYDQFSIKQLAGDMLPGATPDDLVATGFHRNTMLNEEGGIDPLEYRFYAMVDRVGVTGTTWLGLTLNCAQCHTHKYDPIDHADFYRLMALLNNADEPTYYIPTPEVAYEHEQHLRKIAKMEAELSEQFPGGSQELERRFAQWLRVESARCSPWHVLAPTKIQTSLPHLEVQHDGFILGGGDISKSDTYELSFQAPIKSVRALRIEVASHPSLPNHGPGLTNYEGPIGGFFLSELQAYQQGARITLAHAQATNDDEDDRINDGGGGGQAKAKSKAKKPAKKNTAQAALDSNMSSGWQVLGGTDVRHAAVFHFAQPIDIDSGLELKMLFEKHFACPLGYFRISVTTDQRACATGHPAHIEQRLAGPIESLTVPDREILRQRFLETTPEMEEFVEPLIAARRNPPRGVPTLVMRERPANNPRMTARHHRGEYLQPREMVTGGVPRLLPALPETAPVNRLTFARWLFSSTNPLTARVAVNRQWQAFFGRGIVRTLEDFGYQGDPPSHPELLDWLAVEFVRQGWSMKKLHRLIVTSQTYRQTSRMTAEHLARDPENILLARGARFRLDAEIIRDSALRAAGILSNKMGGPGVFPPQPASVTVEGTYGKIDWKVSEGDDRFRRSLYTFMKRTSPFAMASTFDAPSGESCLARREVSNSPLQALTLLNDQMFVEAAEALARQVVAQSDNDAGRLENIFRRCLTRFPADEERYTLAAFLAETRPRQLPDLQLWTVVCRAVLNLDETITHP